MSGIKNYLGNIERPIAIIRLLRPGAVSNALFYTIGNYGGSFLALAGSLVARGLVTPLAFGAMAYVQAINIYLGQINGIIPSAIVREVPQLDAKGQESESQSFICVSHTILLFLLVFQSLLFLFVSLFQTSFYLKWGFVTVAIVNLFSGLGNEYKWILQAKNKYRPIALLMIGSGGATALLLIGLSFRWEYSGYFSALMIGAFLNFVLATALLKKVIRLRLKLRLDYGVVKRVFTLGSPMILFGMAVQGMRTADRFFVQHSFGLESLGYYSLASVALSTAMLLPDSIVGSYLPRYLYHVRVGNLKELSLKIRKLQGSLGLLMALTIGAAFLMVKPLIALLLPDYLRIVPVIRVLLFGLYFYGISLLAYYTHIAFNRMGRAVALAAISFGCSLVIYAFSVRYGLVGIAWGMVVTLALYASIMLYSAMQIFKVKRMAFEMFRQVFLLAGFYVIYCFLSEIWAFSFFVLYSLWAAKSFWSQYRIA